MTISTRITQLLDSEKPIVQGGMMNVGVAELAGAVSNAGGLGIITALTQPTPDALREEIGKLQSITDKPFAVNITVMPTTRSPDYQGYCEAIVESGVPIVETAGTAEIRKYWEIFKRNGIKILHKCTAARHAVSAEKHGVDAISIDGFECAGHPGEDDIPGLILIPVAADRVSLPIIASGGFADGRGLAAALALGADAINMGTRFCATKESNVHDNLKSAMVEQDELATNLIFRSLKNTARVAKSDVSDEVVRRLERPGADFSDIAELVAGAKQREVLSTGDMSRGIYWASMAQGLIHDIPTVQVLLDRIMSDAMLILNDRFRAMVD